MTKTKTQRKRTLKNVSASDYKKVLKFYHVRLPHKNKTLKQKAEDLLVTKLCKCIKWIKTKKESRAIAICSKSIFTRKGLRRGSFTCKKRKRINVYKP